MNIFLAFQENLNASIYMFSFFRSHVSDVSHGSECRAGFFQGYARCSLCSCRLMTRMGSLEMSPPPPHTHTHQNLGFFSSVLI